MLVERPQRGYRRSFVFSTLLLLTGVLGLLVGGCASEGETAARARQVDLQGHRGARGLLPENTIPSFKAALDHGATTLEVDVVISKDEKVVVSHEPWMAHAICSTPDGAPVGEDEAKSYNLYEMTYAEIAAFDCGRRGHAGFPEQEARPAAKPLLDSVVVAVERYTAERELPPVHYNIEIKSSAANEGVYHPPISAFVRLVYEAMEARGVLGRTNFQSFDPRALEATHALDPDLPVALLVGNDQGLEANLDRLGFAPDGYNPQYALVDSALVAAVHARGMTIAPWTVNEAETMGALLDLGVDGIITDYPDRGRALLDASARYR